MNTKHEASLWQMLDTYFNGPTTVEKNAYHGYLNIDWWVDYTHVSKAWRESVPHIQTNQCVCEWISQFGGSHVAGLVGCIGLSLRHLLVVLHIKHMLLTLVQAESYVAAVPTVRGSRKTSLLWLKMMKYGVMFYLLFCFLNITRPYLIQCRMICK